MIEDLYIKKVNNSFYRLNIKDEEKYKNIIFKIKNVIIPFGVEEYKNKYCMNFELGENFEFNNSIKYLENELPNLLNKKYAVSSIINNKSKNVLIKGHVKKIKSNFVTKYYENKKQCSLFDINKNNFYNLEIEISGIWVYNNMCGLYLHINKIFLIN